MELTQVEEKLLRKMQEGEQKQTEFKLTEQKLNERAREINSKKSERGKIQAQKRALSNNIKDLEEAKVAYERKKETVEADLTENKRELRNQQDKKVSFNRKVFLL